jgi:hypothetical protein
MPYYVERVDGIAVHPTIANPVAVFIMRQLTTAKKKARYKSGPKSNSFLRRVGGDRTSMLRYSI